MIRLIFSLFILNSAFGFAQKAEFKFLTPTIHDWGKVKEGGILEHYFVFQNIGQEPLVINETMVACHCTTVKFPTYPILPQKTDSILVQFDTNKTYYRQNRAIIIKSNTKKNEKLVIKTFVIPKED
ncbi:MAG: DUF1573 domain-containing protein [Brumimicrobium sp.]|nr:DUF1573 domain-containing protein [Brumimicrobium sp.]